jgi:hypothetical protein
MKNHKKYWVKKSNFRPTVNAANYQKSFLILFYDNTVGEKKIEIWKNQSKTTILLCVSFLNSGICILFHSLTTSCTIEKNPIRLKRKHFLNKPYSKFRRFYQFFPITNFKFVEIY